MKPRKRHLSILIATALGISANSFGADIVDNQTTTSTRTLTGSGSVKGVTVDIQHTYVGDLQIVLESPDGTTAVLLDRPGHPHSNYGCRDNNMTVRFEDTASFTSRELENHCSPAPPSSPGPYSDSPSTAVKPLDDDDQEVSAIWYSGAAQAVDEFATAFNDKPLDGDWKLHVRDNASGDTGTLDDWQLHVSQAPPPPPSSCPSGSINFNSVELTSYANQNESNQSAVLDDGSLELLANTWVQTTKKYNIGPNTVVAFEFASDSQGEIHALGFDDDNHVSNNRRHFQFWGTQQGTGRSRIDLTPKYSGSGAFESYEVPVGQYYTGNMHMVFANDNDQDAGTPDNESRFRCVRVFEDASPPPPTNPSPPPCSGAYCDDASGDESGQ